MGADRKDSPAVARRRVSRALRRARLHVKLTQTEVAQRLTWSLSKVQRIESGDVGISATDLSALLRLYGVVDDLTVDLLTKDAAISRRQRWSVPADFREHLTPALSQLLQFEAEATAIRAYQPFLVPGAVQTPAMAHYLLGWFNKSLSESERKVRFDVRMMRAQRITDDRDAPTYLLMLDEAALSRKVGGLAIMAEQLEKMVEIAQRPNIHIRIVKMSEGATVGSLGPFTVVNLTEDPDDAVLYQETYASDHLAQDADTVGYFRTRFEEMWPRCYDEGDSLRLIRGEAGALRAEMIRSP
jgi:transcriptional regulator with XRE-family HTH domain